VQTPSQSRDDLAPASPLPPKSPYSYQLRAISDPTGSRTRWDCIHPEAWQYLQGEAAAAGYTLSGRNSDDGHVGYIAIKNHGKPIAYIYARHGAALDAWVVLQCLAFRDTGHTAPGYWNHMATDADDEPWALPAPRAVKIWLGGAFGVDNEGAR
jgi:hypothetical protein